MRNRAMSDNKMKKRTSSGKMAQFITLQILVCFIASAFLAIPLPAATQSLGVDSTAPNISVLDVDENPQDLAELVKDGPVILDFFSPICSHCLTLHLNVLTQIYENYTASITILSISQSDSNAQDVRNYRDTYGFNWIFIQDNGDIFSDYNVIYTPIIYLVNEDLEISLYHLGGGLDYPDIALEIERPLIKDIYQPSNDSNKVALVWTTMGLIGFELYEERAPNTTTNFIRYAEAGYYNGLIFHRVIDNFVVQGGGNLQNGNLKGQTYPPIDLEIGPGLVHSDGAVALARTSDPDSGTSQFYFCDGSQHFLNDKSVDPNGGDPGYAVFGQIFRGMDIMRAIAEVQTDSRDRPITNVVINAVDIISFPVQSQDPDAGDDDVIDEDIDIDSDGMPDSWENTYWANTSAQATTDSDGDGYSNLQEYLSDTDPTNATAAPFELSTTDTDGDGVVDSSDAYPNDATRWVSENEGTIGTDDIDPYMMTIIALIGVIALMAVALLHSHGKKNADIGEEEYLPPETPISSTGDEFYSPSESTRDWNGQPPYPPIE